MEDRPQSLAIGIDVGATKIAGALVTPDGMALVSRQVGTQADQGVGRVLDRIAELIEELASCSSSESRSQPAQLLGVGIGIPGQIDPSDGAVRQAVNLGWDQVYLLRELKARLRVELPIWVETDANACTLGEFYFGAGRGCQDFIYTSIGSGLGAGAICNGRLVTGVTGKAAEFGHMSLDPDGLPCVCGLRGCAETIVSGPGLLRLAAEYLQRGAHPSRLSVAEELTPMTIVAAALGGDQLALAAISEIGRHLGIVLSFGVSVLNPALIVIGGGLGLAAFDLLAPAAWKEMQRRILPSLYSRLEILPSRQVSSAVGAASMPLCYAPGSPEWIF
ncbi:MAG: ROK family protein [Anaerolineales bacterium]|nr:ROK family protein [Anaerolineales bacterium]